MITEYRRIYDHNLDLNNAYVIYIDRMYPRGISSSDKRIKRWIKDIAPTHELIE